MPRHREYSHGKAFAKDDDTSIGLIEYLYIVHAIREE